MFEPISTAAMTALAALVPTISERMVAGYDRWAADRRKTKLQRESDYEASSFDGLLGKTNAELVRTLRSSQLLMEDFDVILKSIEKEQLKKTSLVSGGIGASIFLPLSQWISLGSEDGSPLMQRFGWSYETTPILVLVVIALSLIGSRVFVYFKGLSRPELDFLSATLTVPDDNADKRTAIFVKDSSSYREARRAVQRRIAGTMVAILKSEDVLGSLRYALLNLQKRDKGATKIEAVSYDETDASTEVDTALKSAGSELDLIKEALPAAFAKGKTREFRGTGAVLRIEGRGKVFEFIFDRLGKPKLEEVSDIVKFNSQRLKHRWFDPRKYISSKSPKIHMSVKEHVLNLERSTEQPA